MGESACVHEKGNHLEEMPSKTVTETEDIRMENEMDTTVGSETPKKIKKSKDKESKKSKKIKEETPVEAVAVVEECEPPKKKKKKDKKDQENGHLNKSIDLNGNVGPEICHSM